MKGKPKWKPVGLSAKKWRAPAQARGTPYLLPSNPPRRKEPVRNFPPGGSRAR